MMLKLERLKQVIYFIKLLKINCFELLLYPFRVMFIDKCFLLITFYGLGAGFWSRGTFANAPGIDNPWRLATTNIAPFDQEFYLIMNLAVGGIDMFPDDATNAGGKPWLNTSPSASADFWNGRNVWLPTWNLDQNLSRDASLIVDYVRVWAL